MPFDLRHAHLAGQERILAKRVVGAPKFQVAHDVDERLQAHVDAQRAILAADHHAVVFARLSR